jgi:hypothetical protein
MMSNSIFRHIHILCWNHWLSLTKTLQFLFKTKKLLITSLVHKHGSSTSCFVFWFKFMWNPWHCRMIYLDYQWLIPSYDIFFHFFGMLPFTFGPCLSRPYRNWYRNYVPHVAIYILVLLSAWNATSRGELRKLMVTTAILLQYFLHETVAHLIHSPPTDMSLCSNTLSWLQPVFILNPLCCML